MSSDALAAALAERVMRWRVGPERFFRSDRNWIQRWRFKPADNVENAFELLNAADPKEYSIRFRVDGGVKVRIKVGAAIGEAWETSAARAITYAVARAYQIEPDSGHETERGGA